MSTNNPFVAGDFVQYSFSTVSNVMEVVKATPKTITVRECKRVEDFHSGQDGLIYHFMEPMEDGKEKTYRMRKSGDFRIGSYARAPMIVAAKMKDGRPYSFTNYYGD